MKKNIYILSLFIINALYAQCNPLEVSIFISEKDGWQFPYSAFYWGMSDAKAELNMTNPECAELLANNEECINECIFLTADENDMYLGRVGCLYYNCPDGELLTQNYEELSDRPIHIYGEYYCAEDTNWNSETDTCESSVCNGDLNIDEEKNVQDVVMLVNEILSGQSTCE